MESEADAASRQVAAFVERQERLSEEIDKLARSLGETEERLRRAGIEGKVGRSGRVCVLASMGGTVGLLVVD